MQNTQNGETKQRETGEPKKKRHWMPPRGIRLYELPHRREKSFAVQWRVDGKAKTKTFPTQTAQVDFAKALVADAKRIGIDAFRLNERETREWRAFRAEIGQDVQLYDVIACWRKHGRIADTLPLADAIAAYTKAKESEGVTVAHLRHFRPIFGRLLDALGNVKIGSVTREQLAGFVDDLDQASASRRSNQKTIRGLFRWLKETRQLSDNPCDGWRLPKEILGPVSVLSVEHAQQLFAANLDQPREMLGRLALEAFAGMRHETAAKLTASAIDFERQIITVPAGIDKNRNEQWIEHAPDCLWTWLAWSKPHEWSMPWMTYRNAKGMAFVRANVPHPRNVLRHSFASYHVAVNGDAGKTAAILTHANLRMLWKHYRGKGGGPEYARGWFEILPPCESGDFPALLIACVKTQRARVEETRGVAA